MLHYFAAPNLIRAAQGPRSHMTCLVRLGTGYVSKEEITGPT
jgi:hypothetical protein